MDLDELVREGARRPASAALEAEGDAYLACTPPSGMRAAGGWWCATATPARARS